MEGQRCIIPNCKDPAGDGKRENAGLPRINTIISKSKERQDGFYLILEKEQKRNPDLTIPCHQNCLSTYVSKTHVKRALKRLATKPERSQSEPPTLRRRSGSNDFDFKEHCLFCGDKCHPRNPKNPKRWKEVVLCKAAETPGTLSLKAKILQRCDERGDTLSEEVRIRVLGTPFDLHAVEARYHRECYM